MTIKELQIIMDKARKEAEEFYNKELEKAKRRESSDYQKELDKIREKAYDLNKEVGFYDMVDMDYDDFLDAMKEYSYPERMKVAYAFFLHIKLLDNIIFDFEEGEG